MSDPIQSIAQNNYILHNIDAKKLYVQEPLFTANSGDAVYVGWRPDETVLWSNSAGASESNGFTLSEQMTNFNTIKYFGATNTCRYCVEVPTYDAITAVFRFGVTCMCPDSDGAPLQLYGKTFNSTNGLTYTLSRSMGRWISYDSNIIGGAQPFTGTIYKIVGINRKENA